MPLEKGHFYEFGPFCLDPAERRLLRGKQTVPLPPKSFDLLVLLVANHDRLMTKNQILESVWAGSFVEESNLTVAISAIRRALGERDDMPYIETVPKAGYRFVAPVHIVSTPPVAPTPRISGSLAEQNVPFGSSAEPGSNVLPFLVTGEPGTSAVKGQTAELTSPAKAVPETGPEIAKGTSWNRFRPLTVGIFVTAAILLLGLWAYRLSYRAEEKGPVQPAARTLAILPFHNLRDDPSTDFLGFSLADAVITKLGRVNAVAVRPSSAVEKYRGQVFDIQKVASDLRVDTILAGNVVREGDDLRITPQLIDVKTNKILWKGAIDVKYDNLLAVQDKVAQEIVKSLELNLTPSQRETLNAGTAVSPLAYEYYLHGVDLYGRGEFPMSVKMLQKSAEIDPNYAPTWAHIGRAYTAQASFKFGGQDQYKRAQAAYEKALTLDPGQVDTRVYMANLLTDTGRVEEAVPLLREALKTSPNHPELHWELGYAYRYGGMLRESIDECERARRIDPGVKITTSAINGYLYTGNYDQFLRSLPDDNDSAFVLFYRGFAKYYQRDFEQATKYFDRAFELDPAMFQAQIGKALTYGMHRDSDKGINILREMERKITERGVGDPEAVYKVAQAYAELGDRPSSLRMLRYSVDNGFFAYPYFQNDRLLDSLRTEAQFAEIITAARKRHEAFANSFFKPGT
jgi:DNA-binding winged helix-turn-helix (wHTH) protein/TolB-like protein/lipopolysaccharide biosynthesis regulator YciM